MTRTPNPNATPEPVDAPALDVEALAERFHSIFPHMAAGTYPLVLTLYRLLARGRPVRWDLVAGVAQAAGAPGPLDADAVRDTVSSWPGLYEGPEGINGFGGLSIRPVSEHRLVLGRLTLYTRCAWDTLFIPELLGESVAVHSRCGHTGAPVRLEVTPTGPRSIHPPGAVLSILLPHAEMAADLTALF